VRPPFLDDLPATEPREGQAVDGAGIVTKKDIAAQALAEVFMIRFDLDDEDDVDPDDEDDDLDDDDEEDEDDTQDEDEDTETWQV
jgi:hypothetical protein